MTSTTSRSATRRRFLAGVAWAMAVAGLGVHRSVFARSASSTGLLGIRAGTRLGGWTVVAVHPVKLGAIAVVLATAEGRRFQVDVMARDANGPGGVAQTEHLDLVVCNRGDGHKATDEAQGLGAMRLARELRAREALGLSPPELLTLRERHRRHPDGAFGVPLS
jgi:hypothetical protein